MIEITVYHVIVANLVGHTHRDYFGYTWGGVLNIGVECGILGGGWCDNDRVLGTRTQDAFNVVSIDANLGILTITRIGNDSDHLLREKKVLSYDYINKEIVSGEGTAYGTKSIARDNYEAPESTNKYLGYSFIGTRPEGATYNITDSFPAIDDTGRAYVRFTGKNTTGQLFWTRMGMSGNGTPQVACQLNAFDVGQAQYLVIRMRSNNDIASLNLSVGTIVGEVSYDNYDNRHAASLNLPQDKLDGEEWTVFVIDLKNTLAGGWFANADGNYTVCRLQLTFNSTEGATFSADTYFDISYMAFVDSMTEVKELVDESEVEVVNASNSSITVDLVNGTHPGDHLPVEVVNGTTRITECSLCGYSFGQKEVPEATNRFISAATIYNFSHFQIDTKNLLKDGELAYVSITSTKANHIHLWTATGNGGSPLDLGANTGKYLVMRARTDAGTNRIVLSAATGGGTLQNMHNMTFGDGQWRTVVVDLASTFQYYQTDAPAGTTVQIRINGQLNSGTSYTIDIAYAAIVDSIEEAAALIDEETFEYYTQWNGAKVIYDTATAQPKQ